MWREERTEIKVPRKHQGGKTDYMDNISPIMFFTSRKADASITPMRLLHRLTSIARIWNTNATAAPFRQLSLLGIS